MKKIVVAGGGVLGSQIAFQSAYCGFDVTILIRKEDSLDELNKKLNNLKNSYIESINEMVNNTSWARGISDIEDFNKEDCLLKVENSIKSIKIENDYQTALKDTYLLIESITEDINIKASFYEQINPYLPENTIIVTNSSTLSLSKLAKYSYRENMFLALHFANNIWINNIAEVMMHNKVDEKYFKEVVKFAKDINMIPLELKKEKKGYLLNSLLVPFLLSAMDLLANGVSDVETIDKAWTYGTGAPKGPFRIIDTVGLITTKNIVMQYQKVPNILDPLFRKMLLPYNYDGILRILDDYIDKGKLGKNTGEGFYKY